MSKFRTQFDFSRISKEIYQWFPGHMAKGLKKMYENLPNVDAVIEVHDARVKYIFSLEIYFKFYRHHLQEEI